MNTPARSEVDATSREIHRVVIELVESLDDEQLRWRPDGFATSIGFHLWHLGREADFLRTAFVKRDPVLLEGFGPTTELWEREDLAARWGFAPELGTTVGTGLTDEIALALPIPDKAAVLGYLRASYAELEAFVERLDAQFPVGSETAAAGSRGDPDLPRKLGNIRLNTLNFLTHDCRHLGMMEVLKGLQTGFGSATETRD